MLRLAKNAGRILSRTWEYPESVETWRTLLTRRHFDVLDVQVVLNEAGLAVARRPEATRR